ncbi:MAG: hypothetical protein KatS3mg015_0548 [Fimbriimonadales bacterium]|nr:MAG: hypothetical protein KatS3mg015_0548 [Fimbriimonadales bacterium]
MKRTLIILGTVFGILAASVWYLVGAGKGTKQDVIYRTTKVTRGDVVRSFTATGVLQPLTTVDVKSKAGGEVIRLAVEEGDYVRKGDLIAEIDPRDTKALYEQAAADLDAAVARKRQSELSVQMQRATSQAAVTQAETALESAKLRLKTLEDRARIQPTVTSAAVQQAQANYDQAVQALEQLKNVTIPQTRAQVETEYERTRVAVEVARADLERQRSLLEKGYISQQQFDQARTTLEAAEAAFRNASERRRTLDADLQSQLKTAEARVAQSKAALDQAKANQIDVEITKRDLEDARLAVKQAEAALQQARANLKQIDLRIAELQAADASIVRSEVARDNAKVQLESTSLLAPRDGVVILKYVEEGTIIPPGTSVFSEGTSIVQIADVSKMYVEVFVDEADIGQVSLGQKVRVTLESSPGQPLDGVVSRINPAATTTNGLTQVAVRVEINYPTPPPANQSGSGGNGGSGSDRPANARQTQLAQGQGQGQAPSEGQGSGQRRRGRSGNIKLMPGLNASCEFIISEKKDVLMVPSNAIHREDGETYVEVMVDGKPQKRPVKVGQVGDVNTEIVEGLQEGEEVVTSKIDLRQIEEEQRRLEQAAQQRSPFSGGGGGGGGRGR